MTYSMKSENKLDGASNFRAWKTKIDLILSKNKMLDIVKGNIVEPEFEEGKEKEPQNIAVMEKFKDSDINSMSIIVESIKDHLIPYIFQLKDQLQAIEEITLEKELVNIVLNGLPKMWDAFSASMNTRKEYLTFEELWTCCAQEESRISAKEKPQKKYDDQAFTARFKNFRNKRKFGSRRKSNQEKDILEVQCFNY
jgi:hypothetical protein